MFKKQLLFGLIASLFVIASCSDEELDKTIINNQSKETSKAELMQQFASVLSEVVYEQEEVRAFLKEEALSQFDYNYDILWAKVRNEEINGKSIRKRIIEKSSDEFVEELENVVPTLNILFPELPMGFSAKTYETSDKDLLVALRLNDTISLFWNGLYEDTLSLGEMPMSHVLVVNENRKVRVESQTRSASMAYSFLYPEFDNENIHKTRASNDEEDDDSIISSEQMTKPSVLYKKAKEAYKFFYDKGGIHDKKYQRDYIYFGITPDNPEGTFNENVREYISFIKLSPNAYCSIADDISECGGDPIPNVKSQRQYDFSKKQKQEFMQKWWTDGTFDFVFVFARSSSAFAEGRGSEEEVIVSAKPSDLWDLDINNIRTWKAKKGGIGKHSVWKMEIKNLDSLKIKTYRIPPREVKTMGTWDIRTESLLRFVSVYELDPEEDDTYEYENGFSFVNKKVWNVTVKGTYGISDHQKVEASTSYSVETERKQTFVQKVTRKVHKGSDSFGKEIEIRYNDPIIIKDLGNEVFEVNEYNLGYFSFGLTAMDR